MRSELSTGQHGDSPVRWRPAPSADKGARRPAQQQQAGAAANRPVAQAGCLMELCVASREISELNGKAWSWFAQSAVPRRPRPPSSQNHGVKIPSLYNRLANCRYSRSPVQGTARYHQQIASAPLWIRNGALRCVRRFLSRYSCVRILRRHFGSISPFLRDRRGAPVP